MREWVLVVVLVLLGAGLLASNTQSSAERERDAERIADIRGVRSALEQYYLTYGRYPHCLYAKAGCESLEGTNLLPTAPRDPLTNLDYNYSASGSASTCRAYHLGGSLERTASQALLTGADAPPKAQSALCAGSEPDFSGLSYAKGGQPCDASAGIAQPTSVKNGETCYDLISRTH